MCFSAYNKTIGQFLSVRRHLRAFEELLAVLNNPDVYGRFR
jgi:hypothetical protein